MRRKANDDRAGGTLATLAAAERDDVPALVLFEPITSGRNYVRQLLLEAELVSVKFALKAATSVGLKTTVNVVPCPDVSVAGNVGEVIE